MNYSSLKISCNLNKIGKDKAAKLNN